MTKDKNISENSSHCFEGVKSIALLISFVIFSFSAQAQTVFSPRLTCVINDFVGSNITIEWQNIPNGCGPFVGYKIFAANYFLFFRLFKKGSNIHDATDF
jgi:hypothetical protein